MLKRMKLSALLVLLPLAAAAAPAPAARPAAAPADLKQKALDEIAAWRGQMPHGQPPSPLTKEFEPRLDRIEELFKAADAADPRALAQPRKDFEEWQHEFVTASCRLMPAGCASSKQLYRFSALQRESVADFARQRAEILDPKLREARNAEGPGAKVFYDNDTHQSAAIMLPGGFGSPPPPAEVNAAPRTPKLETTETPLPPPAAKPFSLASLAEHFDYSGLSDRVIAAVEGIKNEVAGYGRLLTGFAGSCYYGAKWLMIKAGMLPPEVKLPEQIESIGIGSGHAYMFDAALKRNPSLQAKLHVRPLKLADIRDSEVKLIPEKTIFVFDRGCAGMSAASGHAEMKLDDDKLADLPASAFYRAGRRGRKHKPSISDNEVLACSDGCMLHTAAYLRAYGRQGCLNAYAPVLDHPAPPPLTRTAGL